MPPVERALTSVTPGEALRRLRERTGQSVRDVSAALGWSSSKLSRIETSSSGIKPGDLTRLLVFYGVPDEERSDISAIVQQSARRGRRSSGALPEVLEKYIRYEAEAASISAYGAVVVPGLLQIPEYAAALIHATPTPEDQFAQARMEVRLVRQAIFARMPPLRLNVVIDEAVLCRPIGGNNTMRRQLSRLQELGSRPETSIRVVPFAVGAHPALTGPFAILDFPDDAGIPPHVFCDGLTGGILRNGSDEVERYRGCFAALEGFALSVAQSAKVFAATAGGKFRN